MTPQQRYILAIAVKEGTVDMVRLQSRSGFTRRALRELVTRRARLDMDALCQRHDLYDDA